MSELHPTDGEELSAEDQQTRMAESVALLEDVEVVSASIRYEDAELVGNLLDHYADKAGVDRATFVESLQAQAANLLADADVATLSDLFDPAPRQLP